MLYSSIFTFYADTDNSTTTTTHPELTLSVDFSNFIINNCIARSYIWPTSIPVADDFGWTDGHYRRCLSR